MTDVWKWIEIIAMVLGLIAGCMSGDEAVSRAAKRFGVSENSIWKHGGF